MTVSRSQERSFITAPRMPLRGSFFVEMKIESFSNATQKGRDPTGKERVSVLMANGEEEVRRFNFREKLR
jgi:hypothetical protein